MAFIIIWIYYSSGGRHSAKKYALPNRNIQTIAKCIHFILYYLFMTSLFVYCHEIDRYNNKRCIYTHKVFCIQFHKAFVILHKYKLSGFLFLGIFGGRFGCCCCCCCVGRRCLHKNSLFVAVL